MISPEGKRRLTILAEHLAFVEPSEFDLNFWWTPNRCKTVACAVGHACSIPQFRELGLAMTHTPQLGWSPSYQDQFGFHAAAAFFGISFEEANRLFSASCYPPGYTPPSEVAAAIWEFLEQAA